MVLSELAARLNCAEYKNWVKAGHCLLLLRSCLQGFVGREVLSFHRGLLAAAPGLGPRAVCRGGSRCSPRARQFQPQCQVCAEWKREILRHHVNRNGDVHWGNCRPGRWPVDAWEVAKGLDLLSRLECSGESELIATLNSWAQAILLPQPLEYLGL
uniref:Isoform 3 of Uncharacterized protein CXorf38 n=1 Tax=Homo sapiens TaxID=9606 RepID=Q8TB03-3|nr:hypothetical protein [Homo sapiens]